MGFSIQDRSRFRPPVVAAGPLGPIAALGRLPPGIPSNPLVQMVDRLLGQYVSLVGQERIFRRPPTLDLLRPPILRYTATGETMPMDAHFNHRFLAICSVARQMVLDPGFNEASFSPWRAIALDRFPEIPRKVNRVSRADVERMIAKNLKSTSAQSTTMVLGAGRDFLTIEEGLRRGNRVVVVDSNAEVIRELSQRFAGPAGGLPANLVLEQVSYADPDFMERYRDTVDRAYLLMTNDHSNLATVLNVVRPGGIVVTQDMGDTHHHFTTAITRQGVVDDQFELVHQYDDATPAFDTPWSRIVPSGLVISILRRRSDSTFSQRFFVTVPEATRRQLERMADNDFVDWTATRNLPPPEIQTRSAFQIRRMPGNPLGPILDWMEKHYLGDEENTPAYDLYAGLLGAWLVESPGEWPIPDESLQRVRRLAATMLHDSFGRLSDPDVRHATGEIVHAIVPRQLAVAAGDHYERHRDWINRVLPLASEFRKGLSQTLPMDAIRAALAFETGRDQTTFFFGPASGEEGLVRDALRARGRGGRVYLVDRDSDTLRRFQDLLGAEGISGAEVLEEDYATPSFADRFRHSAERVYLIYPNRLAGIETAADILSQGGRLVFQHIVGDGSEAAAAAPLDRLLSGFRRMVAVKNARPVIRTAQSRLFPAGNLFGVWEKKGPA